jgi:hypothetical protein
MTTTAECDVFTNCDVLSSTTLVRSKTIKQARKQSSKQSINQRDDIVAIAHAIVTMRSNEQFANLFI